MKTKFLIAAVLSSMLLTACGGENKTADTSNSDAIEDVSTATTTSTSTSTTNENGVRDDVETMIKSVGKEGYYEPAMKLARALQATLDTTSTNKDDLQALNINYTASMYCLHKAAEVGPSPFENGLVTGIIDQTLNTSELRDKHRQFLMAAPIQDAGIILEDIVCN